MRCIFLAVFILVLCSAAACSQDKDDYSDKISDTPEHRADLTSRYFELVPFRKTMNDVGEEVASSMPEELQDQFRKFWKTSLSTEQFAEIEAVAKQNFTKHMTVDEIQAFIRFMEEPAGRSAMDKMKFYVADMMPLIQKQAYLVMTDFQKNQNE